jgi:protein SCO1/2
MWVYPSVAARSDVRVPEGLITQEGRPFGEAETRGKPVALFFGYTHCPDVCPTTLFELSNDLAALGEEAQSLQVVFVTVDPARDTPEVLKEYLSSFDPRIVALTGSIDAIVRLAHTYGTTFRSLRSEEGYTIEHSPAVFLLGSDGQLAGVLSFNEDRQAQLTKLRELLR